MGERKGQNHYYPPDFNWKKHGTLNAYHGVHALRERGARAHEGILTIRFEMPFNVWCLGCNNHIAMSVRYNAEKKKIGMYYTTPLYEFRMKCHLCDNYFTIRTDPKNFDYEMVEGLRRQEIRFDPSTIDNLAPVDRTMSLKLGADAMFKAEHTVEDKQKLAGVDQQIQRLEVIQTRLYDDYGANSVLRGAFRRERKCLNETRARDHAMKQKLSTELNLLPESAEDRLAAQRLALSKHLTVGKSAEEKLTKEKLLSLPLVFPSSSPSSSSSVNLLLPPSSSSAFPNNITAAAEAEEDPKQALIQQMRMKRAAEQQQQQMNIGIDQQKKGAAKKRSSLGICLNGGEGGSKKQKRSGGGNGIGTTVPSSPSKTGGALGLVTYDDSSSSSSE